MPVKFLSEQTLLTQKAGLRRNVRLRERAILRRARDDWEWTDKTPKVKMFNEPHLRHTWASWHRQSGTPTHELQRLGGWRSSVMVERYAHLAPDYLARAANRLDLLLGGYDLATLEKEKGSAEGVNPL
jgi:integrase